MRNDRLRKLILTALLVAIGIVLTNFVSITYPPNNAIIRFGIGFLPLILISIIMGPKVGLQAAIAQDVLGYIVYFMIYGVVSGPFYLGFTLNAIIYGVVPGLIYHNLFKNLKIFNILNFVLVIVLISLGVYVIVEMPSITSSISDTVSFETWFLYLLVILGEIGLFGILYFVYKHRLQNDANQRIIFSVIFLQIIISLILTPLYLYDLYEMSFWAQLPLRLLKTPIEIVIYSFLLIALVKVLKRYQIK